MASPEAVTNSDLYAIRARLVACEARLAALEQLASPLPAHQPAHQLAHQLAHPPASADGWIPIVHKDPHCGRPALYLTRAVSRTERASLALMRVCPEPERVFREPAPNEASRCTSCGLSARL